MLWESLLNVSAAAYFESDRELIQFEPQSNKSLAQQAKVAILPSRLENVAEFQQGSWQRRRRKLNENY